MTIGWIVGGLFLTWIALAWQIGSQFRKLLERTDRRFDRILEQFEGLRDYLYEIDPQFQEELSFKKELWNPDGDVFAGSILNKIENEKKERGVRTLDTPFA